MDDLHFGLRNEGFIMSEKVYVDKKCRNEVKRILGERLWSIYEREKIKRQHAEGDNLKKLTYGVVAEECFCEARTIERMVHGWDPQLPTIFNLWLFYEALDVSVEEQLEIQNEITNFICEYMKKVDN